MGQRTAGDLTFRHEARCLTEVKEFALRHDHPYISAVVVVHDLYDGLHRSDTYLTHSPAAATLPSAFFAGPDDAFYDYSAATDSYVERARQDVRR
jgi:hypothetical protein